MDAENEKRAGDDEISASQGGLKSIADDYKDGMVAIA
jgi:hypothetical protein